MMPYEVTLTVSDDGYGSLTPAEVSPQECGTKYSVDKDVLVIGVTRITPEPVKSSDGCVYEFDGWYNEGVKVTMDGSITATETFTAKFVKYCTVALEVFKEGYGSLDPASIGIQPEGTQYSASGSALTVGDATIVATPADEHTYGFVGWFIGEDEARSGTIESPVTFTARFDKPGVVTLTFTSMGNDVETREVPDDGMVGELPSVNEPGYNLEGWFDMSGQEVFDNTQVADLNSYTITAEWKTIQYSITYKDDATKLTGLSPTTYTVISASVVLPTDVDKPGHEFKGWYDNIGLEGDPVKEVDVKDCEDKIFYAKFIECFAVTLTVDKEGYGSLDPAGIADQPEGTHYSAEGRILTIGSSKITAKASDGGDQHSYEFVGWFIGDDEVQSGTIDSPVTFTARFAEFFDPEIGASFTVDGLEYTITSFFIAPTVKVAGSPAKTPPVVRYQGIDYVVDKYKALVCGPAMLPYGPFAYAAALLGVAGFDPDIGASFTVDGLEYTITSFCGSPTVKVTGYSRGVGGLATISPVVRYQGIDYAVQSVGIGALEGFPARSLTVGVDVEAHAFQGSAVRALRLTEGVTGIAEGAFGSCAKLSDVTFPNTLKQVGENAFGSCTFSAGGSVLEPTAENLSGHRFVGNKSCLEAYVPPVGTMFSLSGIRYVVLSNQGEMTAGVIGLEMPSRTLTVPESAPYLGFDWSVTTVCPGAFYGNPYLTEIDLGMVKTVGSRAFSNCCSLRTLTMSHVETLGECCFSNCCSLKSLDLQPLKAIGPGSFSQCSGLRQVSFGDTLEIVGAGAFSKTTFYGQNGKPVPKTADGLRGHSFEGSGGKLRLVAA
jgi:hypothetical protein